MRDADAESRHVDTGGGVCVMNWEIGIDIMHCRVYKRQLVGTCRVAQGAQLGAL